MKRTARFGYAVFSLIICAALITTQVDAGEYRLPNPDNKKMAVFEVTAPNGKKYRVTAPGDTTDEALSSFVMGKYLEDLNRAEDEALDRLYAVPKEEDSTFFGRLFGTDKGSEVKYRRCANYAKTLYQERLDEAIADPLSWKLAGYKSPKDMAEASRNIALANCRKWHR
jgi:hypothetical protein